MGGLGLGKGHDMGRLGTGGLGTGWARVDWARTRQGRARHGRIVSERHGYPLMSNKTIS
jgi:hypothetical protein